MAKSNVTIEDKSRVAIPPAWRAMTKSNVTIEDKSRVAIPPAWRVIGFLLLFVGCQAEWFDSGEEQPAPSPPPVIFDADTTPAGTDDEYGEDFEFTLPTCAGTDCCRKTPNCEKRCDVMFPKWEHRQECLDLPLEHVGKMYTLVSKTLQKPDEDNLTDIEWPVLWSVLKISEQTWLRKIHEYSRSEARAVLLWLTTLKNLEPFIYRSYRGSAGEILTALFRQNARTRSLMDDNRTLSGMRGRVDKDGDNFFKIAEQKGNIKMLALVHEEVVLHHICDYKVNRPRSFYLSDESRSACVLAMYCSITGKYVNGVYKADNNGGRRLRKNLAGELHYPEVEDFIENPLTGGGLEITVDPNDWPNKACSKLAVTWKDGGIKFGL